MKYDKAREGKYTGHTCFTYNQGYFLLWNSSTIIYFIKLYLINKIYPVNPLTFIISLTPMDVHQPLCSFIIKHRQSSNQNIPQPFLLQSETSILHRKKTYNPSDVLLYKPPFLNKANLIDQFSDGPNYLCAAVPWEEHIIRTVGAQPVITTLY